MTRADRVRRRQQARHGRALVRRRAQQNPYQTVANHFKLAEGRKIGSTAGITIDRDGSPPSGLRRCGDQYCAGSDLAPILKFDESGKDCSRASARGCSSVRTGSHIDREGNVWGDLTGEGPDGKDPRRNGKGHQVFKLSQDGKVLMTLGKAGVAGDGPDTFNAPSAVLVAPNGDIFVGDGHGGNTQRPHREVLEGRQVHQGVGQEGDRPG